MGLGSVARTDKGDSMSSGDLWKLPDGRKAIEVERSGGMMRVLPIHPDGFPWLSAPEVAAIGLCVKQPSRYLHGAIPVEERR